MVPIYFLKTLTVTAKLSHSLVIARRLVRTITEKGNILPVLDNFPAGRIYRNELYGVIVGCSSTS